MGACAGMSRSLGRWAEGGDLCSAVPPAWRHGQLRTGEQGVPVGRPAEQVHAPTQPQPCGVPTHPPVTAAAAALVRVRRWACATCCASTSSPLATPGPPTMGAPRSAPSRPMGTCCAALGPRSRWPRNRSRAALPLRCSSGNSTRCGARNLPLHAAGARTTPPSSSTCSLTRPCTTSACQRCARLLSLGWPPSHAGAPAVFAQPPQSEREGGPRRRARRARFCTPLTRPPALCERGERLSRGR